ncbi:hypothetical protein ACN6AT_36960 (plasmid) [Streptomyces sp. JL4002]|uniref:hypothetical protein n=1 Tax=Streptomyces sp. JL4002 TaxID=3404781 RepID=UPI003B27FD11
MASVTNRSPLCTTTGPAPPSTPSDRTTNGTLAAELGIKQLTAALGMSYNGAAHYR